MRPTVKFLEADIIVQILAEACNVLCQLGIEIQNQALLSLLADHGARIDAVKSRAYFPGDLVERALATAPSAFKLFDIFGRETHHFSGDHFYFTPGSAAVNILDYDTQTIRQPKSKDYIDYTKIVHQLEHIASQSTALIPADVPEAISDSYRLFLSLLYGQKPVITGAFSIEALAIIREMLLAIRGTVKHLQEKPLAVLTCCPTSPLKWNEVASQNLVDCARASIPVEVVTMPLAGFSAPVTLTGTVIQHTVEVLSGIVISQVINPGTPVLYGGSPAIFDIRCETTPMGAVESMMISCANNEIAKYLGLPSQAYIALSDAKHLDAQAGLESAMGATLAALSGINNISGPGMLDFENCQSLEKLVVDNEICGMTYRLAAGIEPKDDFPSLPLLQELLAEEHLLIAKHTRRYLKKEHYFPGPVINRASRPRWIDEGSKTLRHRAHEEVIRLRQDYQPPALAAEIKKDLIRLMEQAARQHGLEQLPEPCPGYVEGQNA